MATTVAVYVTVRRAGRVLSAMYQRVSVKCPDVLAMDAASRVIVTANVDGEDNSVSNVSKFNYLISFPNFYVNSEWVCVCVNICKFLVSNILF